MEYPQNLTWTNSRENSKNLQIGRTKVNHKLPRSQFTCFRHKMILLAVYFPHWRNTGSNFPY